jgi:hypothetical protein
MTTLDVIVIFTTRIPQLLFFLTLLGEKHWAYGFASARCSEHAGCFCEYLFWRGAPALEFPLAWELCLYCLDDF